MIDLDDVGDVLWKMSKVVGAVGAVAVFAGFAVWEALLYAGIKISNPGIFIAAIGIGGIWIIVTGKPPAPPRRESPPPAEPPMTPSELYRALKLLEELRRTGAISGAEADRERTRLMPPVAPPIPPSRRRP